MRPWCILNFYLDRRLDEAVTLGYAVTVRGMMEADATEVQVVDCLHSLELEHAVDQPSARRRREVALSLWHVAKCAQLRDRATRERAQAVVAGDAPAPRVPLGEWLAERLLRDEPAPDTE
jgi:hypothetical protein